MCRVREVRSSNPGPLQTRPGIVPQISPLPLLFILIFSSYFSSHATRLYIFWAPDKVVKWIINKCELLKPSLYKPRKNNKRIAPWPEPNSSLGVHWSWRLLSILARRLQTPWTGDWLTVKPPSYENNTEKGWQTNGIRTSDRLDRLPGPDDCTVHRRRLPKFWTLLISGETSLICCRNFFVITKHEATLITLRQQPAFVFRCKHCGNVLSFSLCLLIVGETLLHISDAPHIKPLSEYYMVDYYYFREFCSDRDGRQERTSVCYLI